MKYCSKCGSKIKDGASFCHNCGEGVDEFVVNNKNSDRKTLFIIAEVFAILSCAAVGWTLLPLAWMVPMTVKIFKMEKEGTSPTTAFKVCSILFLSIVSGIVLFFVDEN